MPWPQTAHEGQTDRAGKPYIQHPLTVARYVMDVAADAQDPADAEFLEAAVCAGLLHDVVEDTDWTLEQLAEEGFPAATLDALALLTHDEAVPYMDYVAALSHNPVARTVKLADLRHNSQAERLPQPLTDKDKARLAKYAAARNLLEQTRQPHATQAPAHPSARFAALDRLDRSKEDDSKEMTDMSKNANAATPAGLDGYDQQTQRDILQLRSWIEECPSEGLVFFGGAGVSTESGIPDFRSPQGLFAKGDRTDQGLGGLLDHMPPEQIVSHSFFEAHPREFFRFYFDRMVFPNAQPNRAHRTLARLEHEGICRAAITQNIDGLHQAAGSKNVWELHGSVHRNYCEECRRTYNLEEVLALHAQAADGVPRCTACDGIVRPDVVLYEEPLDPAVMEGAIEAISKASMLLVAGTSLVVYPAAGLLQYFQGSHLAVVNLQPTPMDRNADLCVAAKIGDVLDF